MFAVIAPALISGAYAERMKFSAYALFTLGWTTLVYDPIAHWSWAPGGWLMELGAIDFAGGTVVHLSSGISALVVALVLGKRKGYPAVRHPPHDLTMTVLGAGLLWFGWFGFNAGGASLPNGTRRARARQHAPRRGRRRADVGARRGRAHQEGDDARRRLGAGRRARRDHAGRRASCRRWPRSRSAPPRAASATARCCSKIAARLRRRARRVRRARRRRRDRRAAHRACSRARVYNNGNGGGLELVGKQAIAIGAAGAWAAVVTFVLLKVIDRTVGLRVEPETEHDGLDGALHGESAYGSLER